MDEAHEWASGDGFKFVADRFDGIGPFVLNEDPRNILVDIYREVIAPLVQENTNLRADRDKLTARLDEAIPLAAARELVDQRNELAAVIEKVREAAQRDYMIGIFEILEDVPVAAAYRREEKHNG